MAKMKISVTIDKSVIERVDRFSKDRSRSDVVERALKRWLTDRRRRQLEDEITAYYSDRREEERLEDEEWAWLGTRHLDKSWK